MSDAIRDQNHVPVALGTSSTDGVTTLPFKIDPVTGRLLVDSAAGGSGTVTSVSVISANGFAGSVATATTTPAITLSTTINSPVLAGNGTAISAATTTGSGSTVVLSASPTLVTPVLGVATATSINGLTVTASTGTLTITNSKTLSISDTTTIGTNSITLAGGEVITFTATNALTFTTTGSTNVTLPTSGTLVNTAVTTLSSLDSVGTITTGVWNATDIPLSAGGTGATLADPGADRIMFWDESANSVAFLTAGSGLTITDTTITANGGGSTVSITPYGANARAVVITKQMNSNTTGYVGTIVIPFSITVNKLSIENTATATAGTFDIGVYSQDGQTKHIDITTASIAGAQITTTAVASVALSAGVYYVVIVPNSTADSTFNVWQSLPNNALDSIASEPIHSGSLTVSAGTLPATFNPVSDISANQSQGIIVRIDN